MIKRSKSGKPHKTITNHTKKKYPYFILLLILALAIAFIYIRRSSSSPLVRNEFVTAIVETGEVNKTIEASGEVEAENEVLLLSPSSSIVKKIVKVPGSKVSYGDTLLILDPANLLRQIESITDQLEVKRNSLLKNQLSSRTSRIDLDHEIEVKKLKIASLKSELEDQKELLEVGGISQAKIDKTKQELVLAEKDLKRVSAKHNIKLKQLEADEDGLLLQIAIKEKELEEKQELLNKMAVTSPGAGFVVEIGPKQGEMVRENAMLVRISEHTTFKIIGEINAKKADQIKNGSRVFVILDTEILSGRIGNVRPEMRDDKLSFDVFLSSPGHKGLRANQKLNLQVVVRSKKDVIRVKKGKFFEGSRRTYCYVIKGDKAIRREIKTGLAGFGYVEIKEGLFPLEEVVVSGISGTKAEKELEIVKSR